MKRICWNLITLMGRAPSGWSCFRGSCPVRWMSWPRRSLNAIRRCSYLCNQEKVNVLSILSPPLPPCWWTVHWVLVNTIFPPLKPHSCWLQGVFIDIEQTDLHILSIFMTMRLWSDKKMLHIQPYVPVTVDKRFTKKRMNLTSTSTLGKCWPLSADGAIHNEMGKNNDFTEKSYKT